MIQGDFRKDVMIAGSRGIIPRWGEQRLQGVDFSNSGGVV